MRKKRQLKKHVDEILANVIQLAPYPVPEKHHPSICWKPQPKFPFIKIQKWKRMTVREWLS